MTNSNKSAMTNPKPPPPAVSQTAEALARTIMAASDSGEVFTAFYSDPETNTLRVYLTAQDRTTREEQPDPAHSVLVCVIDRTLLRMSGMANTWQHVMHALCDSMACTAIAGAQKMAEKREQGR